MAKKRDYRLTDDDLQIITVAMRSDKRPTVRARAAAVHMLHLGKSAQEIATVMNVGRTTVYQWYAWWSAEGLDGLADGVRSGRPRKTNAAYEQELERTLGTLPHAYGYDFALWTVDRLAEHLYQRTAIRLCEASMHLLLKRLGYVYRRPKYALKHMQDPKAVARAEEMLAVLKGGHNSQTLPSSSSLWTKPPVR